MKNGLYQPTNKEQPPQTISLPIYATGEEMVIPIKTVLYDHQSAYQHIKVVDSEPFGRCLIINDSMQVAESDYQLYNQAILKMLRPEDRKIVILGSGDGFVPQEALAINPELHIDLAELDSEIVHCAREFFGQKIFDDSRLHLHIGDGLAFLENELQEGRGGYDGLICDFTGEPVTEAGKAEFERFYGRVIFLAHAALRNGGWIVFQAGDTDMDRQRYIDTPTAMSNILEDFFADFARSDVLIPSYGERDTFLYGWKRQIK